MAPVLGLAAVTGHFFKLFSTNLVFSTLLLSAILFSSVPATISHDRQTLLSFRSFTIAQDAPRTYLHLCLTEWRTGSEPNNDPNLRGSSDIYPVPGKRRRKRGKQAGIQVRIRLLLKHGLSSKHRRDLLASCPLFGDLSATSAVPPGRIAAQFIRPSFLRSAYPHSSVVSPVPSISGFYKHRGSNPANLCLLSPAVSVVSDSSTSLSMILLNSCSVNNKTFLLNDLILSKSLDFLFLIEVWQQTSDHSALIELCPSGYSFLSQPRGSGRGGGLAVVFRDHLPCSSTTSGHFASFELQLIKVGRKDPFYCAVVYRPPGPNSAFLQEFSDFLSSTVKLSRLVIVGNFNIHVDDPSDLFAMNFSSLMDSFSFTQHASGPTHTRGHTLDLVFTLSLNADSVCPEDVYISDHHCIFFNLSVSVSPPPARRMVSSHFLNESTASNFSAAFDPPCSSDNDPDSLTSQFNEHCLSILDNICPVRTRSVPAVNPTPWFNDSLRSLKRQCRKIERLWKKTHLHVHLLHLKDLLTSFNSAVRDAMDSFGFTQHVSGPTHTRGHTLDLVFTLSLNADSVCPEDVYISDHHCIFFNLSVSASPPPARRMVSSRFLNESTASNFSAAFDPPCSSDNDPDSLTSQFNEHCLSILDNICPVRTRSVPAVNPTPWFNDSLRSLKRQCRKIERLWKKTHLHVHLLHLKDLLTSFNSAVRDARVSFFSNLVSQSKGNPKVLFNTISSIVSPASPTASIHSVADCENFLSFFVDKVSKVKSSISPSALSLPLATPTRPIILDSFAPVSLPELTKLVNSMKTSACPLHILPSSLFKSAFQSIGPSVLSIINAYLVSGQVPAYFKSAVIHPLLKKPSLNPSLRSSFRPISKLPFISKILEKVVAKQLTAALDEHNIYDSFQSGFRRDHSTETALLRVSNDLLTHSDAGDCSVLVLLDLTAAFDTVDHHLLLERLRDWVGLSGSALEWFSSYPSERSFSVSVSKFRSSTTSLTHGVPQGSVKGPLLFLLYLLPLQHILSSFKGISYHLYADDIQLYISFKPHEMSKLQLLHTCLDSIKTWMVGAFFS
uniref:Reverse transcriptase domain-containing protein n=1 Tax=Nothobranchius furzeri TaxID=105023 RepID=A0A8C6K7Y3_NOTFU